MHICGILSNLGTWDTVQKEYQEEILEVTNAIETIQIERKLKSPIQSSERQLLYDSLEISECLEKYFNKHGWKPDLLDDARFTHLKAVKGNIGVTWNFGKNALNESDIFLKCPLYVQSGRIKLAIILTPMKHITKLMHGGVGSFETLKSRISALRPFPLKYPFVIIGIGDEPCELPKVQELTTDLDQYLINALGLSFMEMRIQTEKPAYDFKEQLPEKTNLVKELCAFANQKNGGLILVGVTNNGELNGIPENEVDRNQLWVTQITQSNCDPSPNLDFDVFEIPHRHNYRLLVIHINELERKPCMVENKIYIRRGSSATPANPDEVRQLIIGNRVAVRLG